MDNFKGDGICYSNEIMSISEVLDVFYVKVTTRYSFPYSQVNWEYLQKLESKKCLTHAQKRFVSVKQ